MILVSRIRDFLEYDVWNIRSRKLAHSRARLLRMARILLLSFKKFRLDACELRCSALTFYTLLSIVPLAAMAFGVAKGFGLENVLEKQLLEKFPLQQDVFLQIFAFANNLLDQTKGGLIAGVGLLVLFWAVVRMLGSIEEAFNKIWEVAAARNFVRKFTDYLSIMLICPVLFITSSSVNVFIQARFPLLLAKISFLGPAVFPLIILLKLLPFVVVWFLFTFIYAFMPNTRVRMASAFFAGIAAGTVYQVVQIVYIAFQIGVSQSNAIYGSFAALPLFLVWLQISWRIILFGAEISFASQNVENYERQDDYRRVSLSFRKTLWIVVLQTIVRRLKLGEQPLSREDLSCMLDMPLGLAGDILNDLTGAGLISETCRKDRTYYLPGRDINGLTIQNVLDAMEQKGLDKIPMEENSSFRQISASLKQFNDLLQKSPANKLLKEIE